MKLIETKILTSNVTELQFTSIPQAFTDLVIVCSLRNNISGTAERNLRISINGSTTGFTNRRLYGSGTSASATTEALGLVGYVPNNGVTANTYGNISIYIPNYTSNTNKTISSDSVWEQNTSSATQNLNMVSWANTSAINSFGLRASTDADLIAGSMVSLYGILKGSVPGITVS
jgi:hypothetical protein